MQASPNTRIAPRRSDAADAAAAADAARAIVLASGLEPEAARNAFLELLRYEACATPQALEPTPAAERAASVWRQTYQASAQWRP